MSKVVTDVSEDAAAEDSFSDIWIVGEKKVGQAIEGGCEDKEEGGWHHQAEFVHGEVVVDAVEEEVECQGNAVIGEKSDESVRYGRWTEALKDDRNQEIRTRQDGKEIYA